MQKTAVLLAAALLLLMNVCPAGAETYVYQALGFENQAVTADFSAGLEPDLMNALADAGFTGDPLICGVMCETYQKRDQDEWRSQWAVMVLLHEGKSLMIYGTRDFRNGWFPWTLTPASEIFLPAGEQTDLRALPLRDVRTGEITDVLPAVCRGRDVYYLSKRGGKLAAYVHEESPGTGMVIRFQGDGAAVARVWSGREETEGYLAHFLWPANVEFWHLEDVPRSIEELKAFEAAHPFPPEGTYSRAVSGGNFRREPTGSSEILGQFVDAAADVLDSRMGSKDPWYRVRVGEIEGWASFPYVNPDHWSGSDQQDEWAAVQAVGKAVRQEALRAAPGGESRGVLAEGTLFHVLLRQDGYYYIAIPREEIAFRQSDDSEYGWVPVDAVKTYASPLRARYGLGEKKLIADP